MRIDSNFALMLEWPRELQERAVELGFRVMREQQGEYAGLAVEKLAAMPKRGFTLVKRPGGATASNQAVLAVDFDDRLRAIKARARVDRAQYSVSTEIVAEIPVLTDSGKPQAAPAPAAPTTARSGRQQVISNADLARPQTVNITQINSAASPEQPYDVNSFSNGMGDELSFMGVSDMLPSATTPEPTSGSPIPGGGGDAALAVAAMQAAGAQAADRFIKRFMFYYWGQ